MCHGVNIVLQLNTIVKQCLRIEMKADFFVRFFEEFGCPTGFCLLKRKGHFLLSGAVSALKQFLLTYVVKSAKVLTHHSHLT